MSRDIDHGEYRDRSIKYGELVRNFDRTATADEMRMCADSNRTKYRDAPRGTAERARAVAEAAYCDSVGRPQSERTTVMTSHWRSVFTRKLDDGRITQSSRTFRGPTDSEASGAAIRDAHFWKRQNEGDRRVTTHVEKVEDDRY